MTISVEGDSPFARKTRTYLSAARFHVIDGTGGSYVLLLEEEEGRLAILFDSVHSSVENHLLHRVRELTDTPIVVQTAGGIQADQTVRVVIPAGDDSNRESVSKGIMRGFLELLNPEADRIAEIGKLRTAVASVQPDENRIVAELRKQSEGLSKGLEKLRTEIAGARSNLPWYKRIIR